MAEIVNEACAAADRHLTFDRKYRVAIVGEMRSGKSVLVNAILDDDLVPQQGSSTLTGARLTIIFDQDNAENNHAIVYYRGEDEIRELIDVQLMQRYGLSDLLTDGRRVDQACLDRMQQIKPPSSVVGNPQLEAAFRGLHQACMFIAKAFVDDSASGVRRPEAFKLPAQRETLFAKVSESDAAGQSRFNPEIGLISEVVFHLAPLGEVGLRPPRHVALVDLPGTQGRAHHDLVILEGIQQAHAVVFIFTPQNVTGSQVEPAILQVRNEKLAGGGDAAAKQIFIGMNLIDSKEYLDHRDAVNANLLKKANEIVPNYRQLLAATDRGTTPVAPCYLLSGAMAYVARSVQTNRALTGEPELLIEHYKDGSEAFNATRDGEPVPELVLQASGVPKLVRELQQYVSQELIGDQIRLGAQSLNQALGSLEDEVRRLTAELDQEDSIERRSDRAIARLEDRHKEIRDAVWAFAKRRRLAVKQAIDAVDVRLTDRVWAQIQKRLWDRIDTVMHQPENEYLTDTYGRDPKYYYGNKLLLYFEWDIASTLRHAAADTANALVEHDRAERNVLLDTIQRIAGVDRPLVQIVDAVTQRLDDLGPSLTHAAGAILVAAKNRPNSLLIVSPDATVAAQPVRPESTVDAESVPTGSRVDPDAHAGVNAALPRSAAESIGGSPRPGLQALRLINSPTDQWGDDAARHELLNAVKKIVTEQVFDPSARDMAYTYVHDLHALGQAMLENQQAWDRAIARACNQDEDGIVGRALHEEDQEKAPQRLRRQLIHDTMDSLEARITPVQTGSSEPVTTSRREVPQA